MLSPSSECVANFFLDEDSLCVQCPANSVSPGGNANRCNCDINHTTLSGDTMTSGEDCVCQADYYVDSSSQCVECPTNSIRTIMSPNSSCTCMDNRRTVGGMTSTSGPGCGGKCPYIPGW